MKKVLIALNYDPSSVKVAEKGVALAKTMEKNRSHACFIRAGIFIFLLNILRSLVLMP